MTIFVKVITVFLILKNAAFLASANDNGLSFFFKTVDNKDMVSSNPMFTDNNKQIGSPFIAFGNQQSDFFTRLKNFTSNINNQAAFTLPTVPPTAAPQFASPSMWFCIPTCAPPSAPITEEEVTEDQEESKDCELSITTVKGKRVCKGKVMFLDDFNNEQTSKDKWDHEVFIPTYTSDQQDMPFNYFDKNGTHFEDGKIVFTPAVMNDQFVRRGHLKLNGCTGKTIEECEKTSQFQWILPPVSSARITTKNTFSFKYGKIEIKAKFPKGDWLVPELWLESKNKKYGEGLESGRIVIAMSRGNRDLFFDEMDLSNKVLESSLLMSSNGKVRSRTLRVKSEEPWQAHYNNYLFVWRPDGFNLFVNGVQIGQLIQRNFNGTLSSMVGFSHDEQRRWFTGSAMAPFDDEFYISLGLSVGGRDFPDDSASGNYKKPWKSRTVKEMLDFYRAKEKWEPSWQDEIRKTLAVSRVKVTAL